jgi:hypothetical protein
LLSTWLVDAFEAPDDVPVEAARSGSATGALSDTADRVSNEVISHILDKAIRSVIDGDLADEQLPARANSHTKAQHLAEVSIQLNSCGCTVHSLPAACAPLGPSKFRVSQCFCTLQSFGDDAAVIMKQLHDLEAAHLVRLQELRLQHAEEMHELRRRFVLDSMELKNRTTKLAT